MKCIKQFVAAGLVGALVLSSQVLAQRQERREERDAQRVERQQLTGEIVRQKEVGIRGLREPHLVVQVETEEGERLPVDLGPKKNLQHLELGAGTSIAASGRQISIGEHDLLVADRLQVDDRTIRIHRERPEAPDRHTARRPDQQRTEMESRRGQIHGEIVGRKQIDLRGYREPHTFVLLETERGTRLPADLGILRNKARAELQPGERITVRGRLIHLGEHRLVVAEQVQTDAGTFQVLRDGGRERGENRSSSASPREDGRRTRR